MGKLTVVGLVGRILSGRAVPPDGVILDEIKVKCPWSIFNRRHLAWYKTKFRQGLLPGQEYGQHVIAQAEQTPIGRPKKGEQR